MKLNRQEAFEYAEKIRETGCCSAAGQTIIHLLERIEELESVQMVRFLGETDMEMSQIQ